MAIQQLKSVTAQLWSSVAVRQPRGPSPSSAWQLWSLLHSIWQDVFGILSLVVQLQQEKPSLQPFKEKESDPPKPEGLAYIDKSPHQWFLIDSPLFKWGLQILAVWLVPKALSWLVRMEALRLAGEEADGDTAVQPQSYWLKYYYRIPFVKADSAGKNTVQAGSSAWEPGSLVQGSPCSVVWLRGPCV